ncbi:MAG: hypothetical protein Q4B69_08420 [Slackia sp.]|nr:hypothetical protein [Slackia sp.]
MVDDMVARPDAWREAIEATRASMIYNLGRGGEVAGAYLLDRVLAKQAEREEERSARHDR